MGNRKASGPVKNQILIFGDCCRRVLQTETVCSNITELAEWLEDRLCINVHLVSTNTPVLTATRQRNYQVVPNRRGCTCVPWAATETIQ